MSKLIFKRILLPVDFSPADQAALQYAAHLVESGGEIVLLHVVATPSIPSGHGHPSLEGRVEEPQQYLATLARTVAVHCTVEVSPAGTAGIEILRIAEHRGVDLIVLPVRPPHSLLEEIRGATAEYLVRHASVPVLSLPISGLLTPQAKGTSNALS